MHRYIAAGAFSLATILASSVSGYAATCSEANGLGFSEIDGNIATYAQRSFSVTLKPGDSLTVSVLALGSPSQHNISIDNIGVASGTTYTNLGMADRTYVIDVFVHEASFSITTICSTLTNPVPTPTPTPTNTPPVSHKVGRAAHNNVEESIYGMIQEPPMGHPSGMMGKFKPLAPDSNDNGHLTEGEEILYWPNPTNQNNRISGTIDILTAYANASRTPDALTPGYTPVDPNWSLRMRFDAAFVDAHGDNAEATIGTLGLSLGHRVNDKVSIGGHLLLGARSSESSALNTKVTGQDLGVGTNVNFALSDTAGLSVGGYYIHGWNRSRTGTVTNRYSTHQLGAGASLFNTTDLGNLSPGLFMTTSGSLRYRGLYRDSYVNSAPVSISSLSSESIVGNIGGNIAGNVVGNIAVASLRSESIVGNIAVSFTKIIEIDSGQFTQAAFSAGTSLNGASTRETFLATRNSYSELSAGLSAGVTLRSDNGMLLDFNGGVSGLGGRATTFFGGGRLSIPLP